MADRREYENACNRKTDSDFELQEKHSVLMPKLQSRKFGLVTEWRAIFNRRISWAVAASITRELIDR